MRQYKLDEKDRQKLDALYLDLKEKSKTFLGYPTNANLDNQILSPFLDLAINNVGDPYAKSNYAVNTSDLECEVLDFFASLLKIPKDAYWGYVTNGGTESNLYGLYLGREKYPSGILYYSEETHYSVHKVGKLLNLETVVIKSLPNGEMDYEDFKQKLVKERPAILNINVGTTMKGAISNIDTIHAILKEKNVKDFYIHADEALFGLMLPFMEGAPQVNFEKSIDSIAISGHKFLGAPIPCGIVLCKKSAVDPIRRQIEYIGSHDATISGSRDGLSVLILWMAIKKYGREGISELVNYCMKTTDYALQKMQEIPWNSWKNPFSNIVVIDRPNDALIKKWQLATEGKIAHLVIMPHIHRDVIDNFAFELKQSK